MMHCKYVCTYYVSPSMRDKIRTVILTMTDTWRTNGQIVITPFGIHVESGMSVLFPLNRDSVKLALPESPLKYNKGQLQRSKRPLILHIQQIWLFDEDKETTKCVFLCENRPSRNVKEKGIQ